MAPREFLALDCGDGCGGVPFPERLRSGAAALEAEDLCILASVEEDEETEVVLEDDVAFSAPKRWWSPGVAVEPVAGEGEMLVEGGQSCIAGIEVAVKAKVLCREALCGERMCGEGQGRG